MYQQKQSSFSAMNPCSKCGKGSFLSVCVKCLKADSENKEQKKNEAISYNKVMEFKDILKIKLKNNDKLPINTWTASNNQSKNYKPNEKNNIGLVCNKDSGIIGVDLDFYTKTLKDGTIKLYDPINIKEHKVFIDKFGEDYINRFDTLTQQTTNGGLHLIFKHDGDLKQTQNESYNIDIRGGTSNGYLVGSGSVVNGKEYKIIHNTTIKPIPADLKEFLLNNLYDDVAQIINKKSIRGLRKVKKDKKDVKLKCEYDYIITEKKEKEIFTEKAIKWIQKDYNNWIIFGSAMKQIGRYDLFVKYSKLDKAKFDKERNDVFYSKFSNKKDEATYFEYMLSNIIEDNILLKNTISDIKYKPLEKDKTKPDEIINIDKLGKGMNLCCNQDYLIKSDTGTGKTTLFKNYIKDTQQKFISVVSRRTLAKEQYDDFVNITNGKCLYYDHYGKGKQEMPKDEQGLVVCFDSLMKIQNWDLSDKVIFLDEFNSIIEYFISTPTMKDKRVDCLEIFLKIFQEAKQIIAVDADISDLSINFIKYILSEEYNFKYIQNKYNHNQNRKSQQYMTFQPMMNKIYDSEAFMVCCDSKARAIEIQQKYIKKHPEKEVLLIVADNMKEVEFEKLDKYPRIIFSPKVIYGLDSNYEGGRDVFCYYEGNTISPSNMVQQVNRERNIKTLYYYFSQNDFSTQKFKTEKELELKIYENNKEALSVMKCDYQEWVSDMYLKLLKTHYYKQDCFNTNKKIHFQQIIYSRGFSEDHERQSSTISNFDKYKQMKEKYKTLEEYGNEHFNIHDVINNRLNTDVLKIHNTNDLRKAKTIFTNDYELTYHLNYCNIFKNDCKDLKDKLDGMNDFVINKIKLDEFKIMKLKEIQQKAGLDNLSNLIDLKNDYLPSKEECKQLIKIFDAEAETDATFKDKNELRTFISDEIKELIGDNKGKNVIKGKQLRYIKPKKKDYKKKSRMTEEEKTKYEDDLKTYEKLPKKYTSYSLDEKENKKMEMIYNHRQYKPSIKYSKDEGFGEWRLMAYRVCNQLNPDSVSRQQRSNMLEFLD